MSAVEEFLREYAALVRKYRMFVGRTEGLDAPVMTAANEMETVEEHIARLYREEHIPQPPSETR